MGGKDLYLTVFIKLGRAPSKPHRPGDVKNFRQKRSDKCARYAARAASRQRHRSPRARRRHPKTLQPALHANGGQIAHPKLIGRFRSVAAANERQILPRQGYTGDILQIYPFYLPNICPLMTPITKGDFPSGVTSARTPAVSIRRTKTWVTESSSRAPRAMWAAKC